MWAAPICGLSYGTNSLMVSIERYTFPLIIIHKAQLPILYKVAEAVRRKLTNAEDSGAQSVDISEQHQTMQVSSAFFVSISVDTSIMTLTAEAVCILAGAPGG